MTVRVSLGDQFCPLFTGLVCCPIGKILSSIFAKVIKNCSLDFGTGNCGAFAVSRGDNGRSFVGGWYYLKAGFPPTFGLVLLALTKLLWILRQVPSKAAFFNSLNLIFCDTHFYLQSCFCVFLFLALKMFSRDALKIRTISIKYAFSLYYKM